jgi:aromatic-L-amino-acid decarboxylase
MDPDEFRRHGHALIDWLAGYMDTIGERQVMPDVDPGDIAATIPETAPEKPEPFEDLIRDLDEVVMRGVTHWQSPGWFAYFPATTSGPSILGELVSAGLGMQGMLWSTSPAATEIENRVTDWLVDLLGLPAEWRNRSGPGGGVIQSTASDSTHLVHVVARERAMIRQTRRPEFVSYASGQAHSSVEKGARVAGIEHFRAIDVDENWSLDPDALRAAIAADRDAGLVPLIVTSALGTTGTAAVDPIAAVSEVANDEDMWHHVDAAYGGSAMVCPELRHLQEGADSADSYTFNPHKWMFTNFDCNVLWVADRASLIDAMSITPPYLRNPASESGEVIDYRDWQVPLGRRFRALKLWWVLRSYGAEGIRHHLREDVRLAGMVAARIEQHDDLVLTAPVSFGLVCFRHRSGNEATNALLDAINSVLNVYLTGSSLGSESFIRVSIGSTRTTAEDVDRLWSIIDRAASSDVA